MSAKPWLLAAMNVVVILNYLESFSVVALFNPIPLSQIPFTVLISSEESLNRGFQNIGSIFVMKTLSNSLGTGLDKLPDEKPNVLSIPRHKAARSVSKQLCLEFQSFSNPY